MGISENGPWSAVLALQRATHVTLQVLHTRLAALDLTASELNVLANLVDGPPSRTVSELGRAVGSKPTTLTSVLDRLERRELITRGAQPGDRRAVTIALTAGGRRAAITIRKAITELEDEALGGLSDRSRAGLRKALDALTETAR